MKINIYLIIFVLCITQYTKAQVGIGTTSPSSQLDIRSSNQVTPTNTDGILIPKVNVFALINPTAAQQGMLVYLTTPTTFGGNPKAIGFYYWDDISSDWIGISSSASGDHDWYEEGTTLAPNAITDNMFHTGNVAIGKNTANSALDVLSTGNSSNSIINTINNSATTGFNKFALTNDILGNSNDSMYAISNTITTSGSGLHFGIQNTLSGTGSGDRFGISNILNGAGFGAQYGISNTLTSTSPFGQYGVYNRILGTSTSNKYGIVNFMNSPTSSVLYGTYSYFLNTGTTTGYGLLNDMNGTSNGSQYGNANSIAVTGNGQHYGTISTLTGSGSGDHFGLLNTLTGNGVGIKVGVRSSITSTNTTSIYGVNNIINGGGTSINYGVYNTVFGDSSGAQYGSYNNVGNSSTGIHYGTYNTLNGTGTGLKYGVRNELNGQGNQTGNYNILFGTGTGLQIGTYNEITTTNASAHTGVLSTMSGSGAGLKTGIYSFINPAAGGTHYGVYSEALKAGSTNFAGYFLGNVGIGTTAANMYTFPPSRGTNNQIMITNGTGVVSWQNASAIQDHDWYEVGTTLAPDAITDVIFHTGNVSIGKITNTFPLDVTSATRTINSIASTGTNAAVFGFNTAAAGAAAGGYGIAGQTNQSGSQAVRGEQINIAGTAISGINFGASGTSVGSGLYGQTSQSNGFGLDSRNINTSGTAIFSVGQNAAGNFLVAGSGGAFNGVTTGLFARNTSLGVSQAIYSDNGGVVCRVNYWSGAIQYKILGTGAVSTTAENTNGERVTLYCPEAPEILFEDYGQGQLVNGSVHIEIDPTIAKNIVVNDKHPLRVYIQLEDECNGVYVTNKTGSSFDVKELASGQSNAKFQYHIVGNRADEVLPNGRISKNADMRFEPAPKNLETREATAIDIGKPTTIK